MVGQLGDIALSSVGMAGQWAWLMNMFLFGTVSGGAIFISQYWGIQDIKGVRRIFGLMLLFAGIFCALFFVSGSFLSELVISVFNRTPVIVEQGSAYLRIVVFSYPAVGLSAVLSAVLRATEKVRLPMYISLVTTVLNAFLNFSLIFGKFGLPQMGTEGAAVATCISSWSGPVLLIIVSLAQKNILYAPLKEIFCFSRADLREFLIRALPIMANEALWGMGTLVYNVIFANLGYEQYAAMTIFRTFEGVSFVFAIGLCNACCIMVGKKIGVGDFKDAIDDAKRFIVLMIAFSVIVGGAILIFKTPLVGIFNFGANILPTTLSVAEGIMMTYAIFLPISMMPYLLIVGIFRSGGDSTTGMKYDISTQWFLAIPFTAIAAFLIRAPFLNVVFVMYFSDTVLKTLFCFKHFLSYRWIQPVTDEGKEALESFDLIRQPKKPRVKKG